MVVFFVMQLVASAVTATIHGRRALGCL